MGKTGFTIIFDLDGTLLNTVGDFTDAANSAMRKLGYPERTETEVLAAIGNGIRRAIVRLLPDGADERVVEEAQKIFRDEYRKCYSVRTNPYPGVVEILRAMRGDGCLTAILSNKAEEFTVGLAEIHFGGLIDAAAGERPGVPLKPAAGAVEAILAQVGGDPGRSVYIGDSEVDIATARNAGIPCILVSWGFRERGALIRAGADPASIADNADELLEMIRAIIINEKTQEGSESANAGVACAPAYAGEAGEPADAGEAGEPANEEKTLYISDLDGTLFNDAAQLSGFTVREINRMISQGMHFSIATARSPASTLKLVAPLHLKDPIIMMNGVLIYDTVQSHYLLVEQIEPMAALGIVSVMRMSGTHGFIYVLKDDVLTTYYESLESAPLRMFYEERSRLFGKMFVRINSYEDLIRSADFLIYFMFRGTKYELLPLYDECIKIPGIDAIICEDNYEQELSYLECFSSGTSKRSAVRFLREHGKYRRVIGFGDNLNDLPMFMECDESYAPENAHEEVKAAATSVIGANKDNSVAHWLAQRFPK